VQYPLRQRFSFIIFYGYLAKICLRKGYDLYSLSWHFRTRWTNEMLMEVFKVAMDVYMSYKFGLLLPSTSAVNASKLSTAGIDHHSG